MQHTLEVINVLGKQGIYFRWTLTLLSLEPSVTRTP